MRIWLGFHANVGIVVFDPLLQSGVEQSSVRLWCVNSQELKTFDRVIVRPRLRTLGAHLSSIGLGPLVSAHRITAQLAKRYLDNRPSVPTPTTVTAFDESEEWSYFDPEAEEQRAAGVREYLEDQDAWARSDEEGWFYDE